MSLVEMMIGITLGMMVLAGAIIVSTTQLADHRRLLLETQVQQDLRVAVDLLARDLRRAGYWAAAPQAVSPNATELAAVLNNPYATVSPANSTCANQIEYSFSRDEEGAAAYTENNTQDQDERTGFRLQNVGGVGVLQMKLADEWQALTDPTVIRITRFCVRITSTASNLPNGSDPDQWPATGPSGGTLKLCQRNATIEIEATAFHDSAVQRSVGTDVRLRNDLIREGSCT
ncbi:MAG: hypothetical protein RLY78_468 [Pseudomonadota bacterium]|jgi:type IV pilus assembly protein PilW